MILLKKIDLFGQLLIFCLGLSTLFTGDDKWVLMSLFFNLPIGCWQILSTLLHARLEEKIVTAKRRKNYMIGVVVFFTILFISVVLFEVKRVVVILPVTNWYFFLASTSLAVWYLYITFRELRIWQHRRFIQLR